jgi:hypothetical protein
VRPVRIPHTEDAMRKKFPLYHLFNHNRAADPHHIYADTDPSFHFKADPDAAPHQSDANLRPLVADGFILARLYCERQLPSMASKVN